MKDDKVIAPLDKEVVLKYFAKYPKFETFIGAGTISLKMAREILDLDRYLMYDIFCELVTAGAVTASGANGFRATKQLQAFLRERRAAARSETEDPSIIKNQKEVHVK